MDFRQYLNGSLRFDYDLDFVTKGLNTHASVAVQTFNRQYDLYFRNLVTYRAQRQAGDVVFLQQADLHNYTYLSFDPNTARDMRSRRTTVEWAVEYKHSFGAHTINAMALYNQVKTEDPDFTFRVANGYQSYVGRVVYNYRQRYLAEISGAYNGTENFAPGKRFGLFPSIAVGWVPSFEAFFPKNGFIEFLKLRASYGQVGNDQLSVNFLEDPLARFLYRPVAFSPTGPFAAAGYYHWGTVGNNYVVYPAIREGRLSNPGLTWERAVKMNVGMEMNLWKNRVNITVDAFHENRDNILTVPQTVPGIIGVQPAAQNIGRMTNRGFETAVILRSRLRSFQYWIKGSYSFARNKIEYQDEIPQRYAYRQRTGQRFGQYFGLVSEGFYNAWEEVNDPQRPVSTFVGDNRLQPGDVRYRDVNGDGLLNEDDMVPLGFSAFPEIIYGFSAGGSYKGFDFSILMQGAANVSTQYSRRANQAFYDNYQVAAPDYLLQSWTPERYAAGLPVSFPRFSVGNDASQSHNYKPSTLWIVNAGYVRLKNAEIGYTFHAALLRRIGLTSARIYFNGNNLFTWSGLLPGIDPESPNLNNNQEPYPLVRTVNAGVSIHF